MMTLFEIRYAPVVQEMLSRRGKTTVSSNCKYLKGIREGECLIKVGRNNRMNYHGEANLYIDFTYIRPGWFALSSRKNAQWFTGAEAQEWIRAYKGFTICKR
jgi:hypothetical protein